MGFQSIASLSQNLDIDRLKLDRCRTAIVARQIGDAKQTNILPLRDDGYDGKEAIAQL
jgi:hypothetical protein